jgi:excisionase family DNA binding protein
MSEHSNPVQRLSFTPDKAAENVGVSRTRIFQAIRDQDLTARKAGRATIIEAEELMRWLQSLPTKGRQPEQVS